MPRHRLILSPRDIDAHEVRRWLAAETRQCRNRSFTPTSSGLHALSNCLGPRATSEDFQMGGNIGTAEQSRVMARTPAPVRITISRNTARSPGDSGDRQSAGGSGGTAESICQWRLVTVIPGRPFDARFRTQKLPRDCGPCWVCVSDLGPGCFC